MDTRMIPIGLIDEPIHAHRLSMDETAMNQLADSIRKSGLINAIQVSANNGRFTIIAGHRRYLAHHAIGAHEIRADVIDPNTSTTANEIQFAENFQRSDLSPIEEARALAMEQEQTGHTTNQIALMVKRTPEWVESRLALLDLPDDLGPLVHTKALAINAAFILARCTDQTHREHLTNYCINSGASSSVIRAWVDQWRLDQEQRPEQAPTLPLPADAGQRPVISLPCFSCTNPTDYTTMPIVRFCPSCFDLMKKAAA